MGLKMANAKILGAGLVLLAAFSTTAWAKLYKWVDNQGVTHYGETIPPEYADKDNVQFNDKGRVIKRTDKINADERRAQEEAAAKKRTEDAAALELRRRDKMLLNTYSNEQEIDLARDRNLQQVEARLTSIKLLLQSAQESQEGYRLEAEKITKSGKKIPASLQADLSEAGNKVARLQQELAKAQEKGAAVRASFEADKAHYRGLTGSSAREPQAKKTSGVKETQTR